MSDVIANAKSLLERATPGPWSHDDAPGPGGDPMRETEVYQKSGAGVIAYVQPLQGDIELIAAAPELAQALAEERYEYCVQIWMGIKWLSLGQGYGMFSIESRGIWWETRDKAQDFMDKCETEHSLRIVRRRVSPPEVINE